MVQEVVQRMQDIIRKHLKAMHTAVPGRVVKYMPERGMCDVMPVMQYKKPNGEWIDYPELKDVPVWWPQTYGQESTIVYPIKPGDEVLVLLMERPIDYWLFGMQTEQDLMFDLSEAICIPGLFAKANPLAVKAQEDEAIIIQRKDTFVEIKEKEIILDSQETVTVNSKKDIYLNAEEKIELTAPEILFNGQDASLDMGTGMAFEGDMTLEGSLEATGDVVASNISLVDHTHVDSEGGDTTAPQ